MERYAGLRPRPWLRRGGYGSARPGTYRIADRWYSGPQRFAVRIGPHGMGIAPAGVVTPMTGHHHLLGDVDKIVLNQPIPSCYNPIHLSSGQSEVVLMLKPGTHTLQRLMGDHVHVPPVMSKKIIHVR